MRNLVGAAIVSTGLVLTGCSGNTSASNTTTTSTTTTTVATKPVAKTDACSLLSADDVLSITGDKLLGTEHSDVDGCNYKTSDDGTLQVQVDASGAQDQMKTFREAQSVLGGIGNAVRNTSDVGGDVNNALKKSDAASPAIGDEAIWGASDVLAVRKGDAFVEVTPPVTHNPETHKGIPLIPDVERQKIAKTTAEKLLAKLAI